MKKEQVGVGRRGSSGQDHAVAGDYSLPFSCSFVCPYSSRCSGNPVSFFSLNNGDVQI